MVAVPLDVHGDTADLSLFVPQPIVLVTFCFFSLATEIFWLCQKRVASFYDGVATCCFWVVLAAVAAVVVAVAVVGCRIYLSTCDSCVC